MNVKTKVSSERIYKFYKDLEANGVENHGLLIMKGNEIVFEEYAYPYSADMPHTLFSVTKSIVSTAAGFAIDEGLFSLDSKIIELFPEYKACKGDEWQNITVRSVLTMQSGKEFSFTQDMTGNYVEMFMKAPFRKKKGFLYSNNDAHIVAALVQKFSGQILVDYLMPRLFEPLEIEKPEWERNSIGECIGGTGAYLKLRDLAKIMRCYADGGVYNGRQVIPEWWTKEAVKKHVDLGEGGNEDGYGYLFWLDNGVYSMNGMYGQQVLYFPKQDAVAAIFNCVIDDRPNNRLMKKLIPEVFEESDAEWDEKLAEYLAGRSERAKKCEVLPKIPEGETFCLTPASDIIAKLMFPASLIPRSLTSSFAKRPTQNLNNISFKVEKDVLTVQWFEQEDKVVINCGLDGEPRSSECEIKGYKYKIWAYAYSENGLVKAVVKPINTLATLHIDFDFSGDGLEMKITDTPSFSEFILHNVDKSSFVANNGWLHPLVIPTVRKALSTATKPMKFKMKQ